MFGPIVRTVRSGLALSVLALAGTSCSSPSEPLATPLVGTWTWVRSTGGIAGRTLTPQTEGYSAALRFTASGTAQWSRDGSVVHETTYEAARSGSGGWTVVYASSYSGFPEQRATFAAAGQLVLTDPCCDGFVFEFERQDP